MAGPPTVVTPLPVGGSALLQFYGAEAGDFAPPSGVVSMTLVRTGSDGSAGTLYAGAPLPIWVDVGDGPSTSSQPLDTTTEYSWTAIDNTGTVTVGPAILSGSIVTQPDALTQLMIRLLQAACDNAPRPPGSAFKPVQVTTQMPAGGWNAMPFAVLNLDLFQQSDTSIGQDVLDPQPNNEWTLPGWARRVWRVGILSQNADERDFYRDTLMVAFRALKATLFNRIGQNIRHGWQANSGTTGDEWIGQGPGLYWADVMMTLEGVFDVTIMTGFGMIGSIEATVTANGVIADQVDIPATP